MCIRDRYASRMRFFRKHYSRGIVRGHSLIVRAGMLRAVLRAWREFARRRMVADELRARLWAYRTISQKAKQ